MPTKWSVVRVERAGGLALRSNLCAMNYLAVLSPDAGLQVSQPHIQAQHTFASWVTFR